MLSKEEIRNARLRAMGITENEPSRVTTTDSGERSEKKRYIPVNGSTQLSPEESDAIKNRMYIGGGATDEDILRWYNQGFQFCDSLTYGLKQGQGGPCGILAVVTAELLSHVLFGNCTQNIGVSSLPSLSVEEIETLFANTLASILIRAAAGGKISLVDSSSSELSPFTPSSDFIVHNFDSEENAASFVLKRLQIFKSNAGCILFLMSLMLSRGLEKIVTDMDVDDNTLIGPFGYCTQELLNLLLTGVSSSNVMDGNVSMHGMTVKGISKKSSIGYLTHLESLRYCHVGDFYKVPQFPIWVIGSTSHFTVLFALDKRVNEETESERLLSLAQRAFKSADPEENGFISAEKLKEVLEVLKYDEIANNESELARLRGHIQLDGGIILWSNFWENVSKLITKQITLDALIDGSSGVNLITSNSSMTVPMDGSSNEEGNGRQRSDSEIARDLQMQWDNEDTAGGTDAPPPLVPPENVDSFPSLFTPLRAASSHSSPAMRSYIHRHDSFADDKAVQHLLYHLNGLEGTGRPARLTPFKLIPRSSQNAIGVSVAMSGSSAMSAGFCHPIEEVLRTRWNGCRVDWMNQKPPSID